MSRWYSILGIGLLLFASTVVPQDMARPQLARRAMNADVLDLAQLDARREMLELQIQGLRKSKSPRDLLSLAVDTHDLSLVSAATGDFTQAEALVRESLGVLERMPGEDRNLTICLGTLGWLRATQGDYATARSLYDRAAQLCKKRKAVADYALALDDQAALELDLGDDEAAEKLYSQAFAERQQAKLPSTHPDVRANLHNLGLVYERLGNPIRAEELLTENLKATRAARGSHSELAHSLETLAFVLGRQRRFPEAESLYQQSLATYQQPRPGEKKAPPASSGYARVLNNLGFLYAKQGDFAKAEPLQMEALILREKLLGKKNLEYADGLEDAAVMSFAKGATAVARDKIIESLNVTQFHLDVAANVQSERQQLLMAKSLRRRLDLYLSMTEGTAADEVYARVLIWKGAVFRRQHGMRLARENPKLKHQFDEISRVARRLSSLVLAPPPNLNREKWDQEVRELMARKEQLERELASEQGGEIPISGATRPNELAAALPPGGVLVDYLRYERTVSDKPGLEGRIAWRSESNYVAFVITQSRIARIDLGPSAPIDAAVTSWRSTINRKAAVTGEKDPAVTLRQLIWAPLEGELGNAAIVLVSPDSGLNRLPFGALPGKDSKKFLLEEIAIAVAPVPQQLPELVRRQRTRLAATKSDPLGVEAASSLLVLGAVNFDGQSGSTSPNRVIASRAAPRSAVGIELHQWRKLEATEGEIASIAKRFRKQFDQSKVTELEEDEATESALCEQAPQHHFLHLATHGFFASERLRSALGESRSGMNSANADVVGYHPGLLSGLVLAGANQPVDASRDDGILTALEVAELDLRNVELAILSACETGLGEEAGGEGILGLQRAFHVAGARTVVASLWEVNDESTRALMERFYDNLWKKKLSGLESLREAQLWMLREGQTRGLVRQTPTSESDSRTPPLYWAAFVLSGDWR